jgi:hypothetical protein
MGWLIFATYVTVWLVYGRQLTIHLLETEVSRSKDIYGSASQAAKEWLPISAFSGFALALLWPVVAPVRGLFRLVKARGLFTTPTEQAEAERHELDALRKQARELGLPMPSDERTGA